MARKRVTYRPNKAGGAFGMVVGGIFVLLGVTVVIPTFGLFGVFWTLIALSIAGISGYQTFGKKYVGPEIYIEDEAQPGTAEERLTELRNLYDRSLITEEEYEAKKQEILKEL